MVASRRPILFQRNNWRRRRRQAWPVYRSLHAALRPGSPTIYSFEKQLKTLPLKQGHCFTNSFPYGINIDKKIVYVLFPYVNQWVPQSSSQFTFSEKKSCVRHNLFPCVEMTM
jgi:hypothetical protein